MAQHLYMDQRNSYAFDKVVSLAEAIRHLPAPGDHGEERLFFNRIDFNGSPVADDPRC